jgi:hypothetical protein
MQDILLLAALAPQNSGVSPRVLRHFNVFSISTLPDESVARIFSSVLHFALKVYETLKEWRHFGAYHFKTKQFF